MSELHRFIFEGLPVRGAMVRLTEGWQELLERRTRHAELGAKPYPALVRDLLGEMTAAAVLMHSHIKFNGTLILQVMGGEKKDASPIKLAVAEVRSDLGYRATAKIVHEVTGTESFSQLINTSNTARCAMTLDADVKFAGQHAYQGIVPLHDDQEVPLESIGAVLEHYMLQSEQLETKLVLAANEAMAVGILIQRLPVKGDNEDFNRIATLTASIKRDELLSLGVEEILYRLYWNEPLARYAPADPAPRFHCTCSRERVASTIRSLGQSQAERLIEEKNGIDVNCDFCGQLYHFDVVDAAMLFMPAASVVTPKG